MAFLTVGVRNYMNVIISPLSLISDFLMDAISLRSKLFNLKVNHEKSICLDGFNSLVSTIAKSKNSRPKNKMCH